MVQEIFNVIITYWKCPLINSIGVSKLLVLHRVLYISEYFISSAHMFTIMCSHNYHRTSFHHRYASASRVFLYTSCLLVLCTCTWYPVSGSRMRARIGYVIYVSIANKYKACSSQQGLSFICTSYGLP